MTIFLENSASHINEYDWLLKHMTGGRLEVDLEKLNDWRRLHVAARWHSMAFVQVSNAWVAPVITQILIFSVIHM